jgi:nucleoid-associated protein YgaU
MSLPSQGPSAGEPADLPEAGEQEPAGWFREESGSVSAGAAAGAALAVPVSPPGESAPPAGTMPPADAVEEPPADAVEEPPADAAEEPAADLVEEPPVAAEAGEWTEEAEVVELAPGTESAPTAVTEPVSVAALSAAGAPPVPKRGSAAARVRTLVISVVVVALTAVLGFAAGMMLPALVPGPGIAGAPTAEPTVAPTVEPTAAPTLEPTVAPTVEPTGAATATPVATPSPSPKVTIHVVKANENLTTIAAKYGVTVKAIQDLNGIKNPNKIYPGQKLKIPPKP